jgi:outer membrane receptor protein involved in Fe transport
MYGKKNKITTLMLAAMVSGTWVSSVSAQEPEAAKQEQESEADDSRQIESITVTARKRSQSVNEVGISINALGSEDLEKAGFTDPSDLSLLVSSFSAAESGLNTPIYTLRGVGFSETSIAASSTVSVYVDEVGLPFPITTKGAALDLQRVEVVKGPQGTLYGQNTTAGAINYISNKPTEAFEASVEVGFARFNALSLGGFVSGALSDNVRARFAIRNETDDGFQESQTRPGDDTGAVDKTSARLLLEIDASDTVTVNLNLNGYTDQGDTLSPQLLGIDLVNPNNPNPALLNSPLTTGNARQTDFDPDFDLSRDDNFIQGAVRVDWEASEDLTFTSISSYSDFDTEAGNNFDGSAAEIFSFITGGEIESFAQELRLSGTHDKAEWVVGVNYSDSDTLDTNLLATGGTTANFVGDNGNGGTGTGTGVQSAENFAAQEITTFGVFASADWKLNEQFTLTTGARFTDFEADFTGCAGDTGDNTLSSVIQGASNFFRTNAGLDVLPDEAFTPGVFDTGTCTTFTDPGDDPTAIFTPGLIVDSLEEDNVSWKAALNYTPAKNALLYASISKGFKAGSFPTIPSTSFEQYIPVTQEELLSYEVGLKWTLLGGTMQLNTAAFFYDYEDKQVRGFFNDPIFGPLSRLVNVPESEVTGWEFDITWVPVTGLTVAAAGSIIDTEIVNFIDVNSDGDIFDFGGGVLSFSPEETLNLDAEYEWDWGKYYLYAGASYAFRGDSSATFGEDPTLNIDQYSIYGVRAGIATDEWQLSVVGENISNEFFLNNIVPQFDTIKGFAGRPISFGVRFKYNFF